MILARYIPLADCAGYLDRLTPTFKCWLDDALTPEVVAKQIHLMLCRMTPAGRMIMIRTVRHEFDLSCSKAFEEGLAYGQAAGWFSVSGEALLRKI